MATNFQAPYTPVVNTFIVSDMIYAAARKAGALKHAGQGPGPSEVAEWLDLLNAMIDGWKIENLLIVYYIRYVFTLTAGKKDYAVAPGLDFSMERPEKIDRVAFVLDAGTPNEGEIAIEVVRNYQQYASLVAKQTTSSLPLVFYYQASFPVGTATFWPVPTVTGQAVALYNRAVLQEFQAAEDNVYMPAGYREMLQFNLAWRIHQLPPYNKMPMDPEIIPMAQFYKQRVKDQQVTPMYIKSDDAVLSRRRNSTGGFPKSWTPYS